MPSIDTMAFKAWLKENTSLSDRSIKDTASRAQRGCKLLPPPFPGHISEQLEALEQLTEFECLSPSVKSQLKKALRLYSMFIDCRE